MPTQAVNPGTFLLCIFENGPAPNCFPTMLPDTSGPNPPPYEYSLHLAEPNWALGCNRIQILQLYFNIGIDHFVISEVDMICGYNC